MNSLVLEGHLNVTFCMSSLHVGLYVKAVVHYMLYEVS